MCDSSTPTRRTPVWRSIAADLRADIAEERYSQGDKLPTEAVLSKRFGVNRHTVRHALTQLIEEGLVHTRRGSGSFVTAQPTDYPIGKRVRFHENLLAAGRTPRKHILSLEKRAATKGEARALQIKSGAEILAYHGVSLGDGLPVALAESLYPLERLEGLEDAMRSSSGITEALKMIGVADYTRISTRITATLATATQALHLRVNEGAPLLRTSSVSVAEDRQPIELGRTWFSGDRVTLTLDG
ncbi:MAG: phosphonate metabolism transcriptional regulator PhnF [Halocynthiibacter sp.]